MRAAERGVGPDRLERLGRGLHRPEWVAAGRFAAEYHQVSDLRQGASAFGAALDQAELTAAAVAAVSGGEPGPEARIRHLFVDEYQDVDPAQVASSIGCRRRRPSWSSSAIPTSRSIGSEDRIRARSAVLPSTGRSR